MSRLTTFPASSIIHPTRRNRPQQPQASISPRPRPFIRRERGTNANTRSDQTTRLRQRKWVCFVNRQPIFAARVQSFELPHDSRAVPAVHLVDVAVLRNEHEEDLRQARRRVAPSRMVLGDGVELWNQLERAGAIAMSAPQP